MLKTFYVGNLEWKATEEELKDFFSPYGQVSSVQIIKDHSTGLSRGFAFITMENADQAMKEMQGKEFRGRSIKIDSAREREKKEYNPRPEPFKRPDYDSRQLYSSENKRPNTSERHDNYRRDSQPRDFNEKDFRRNFDKERQAYRREFHF